MTRSAPILSEAFTDAQTTGRGITRLDTGCPYGTGAARSEDNVGHSINAIANGRPSQYVASRRIPKLKQNRTLGKRMRNCLPSHSSTTSFGPLLSSADAEAARTDQGT